MEELFTLVSENNIAHVIASVKAGADVNAKDNRDSTSLHRAAFYGYIEIVRVLIAAGANITAKDDSGNTPLHLAVIGGHKNAIVELMAAGADVFIKNNYGIIPSDITYDQEIIALIDSYKEDVKEPDFI